MNKLIIICLTTLVFLSCSKDSGNPNGNQYFSPVPVNIQGINLDLPDYASLAPLQGWKYFPGGNRGIVVYHTINDEFVAFDLTCPVDPGKDCAFVSIDSSNTFLKCSQYPSSIRQCSGAGFCNSRFDPSNGLPVSGSANKALVQYQVRRSGNVLSVTN